MATTTAKKKHATKKKVIKKVAVPAPSKTTEATNGEASFHGAHVMSGINPAKTGKQGLLGLVPLKALLDAGTNPRSNVGDVGALAAAIKSEGLLQPLVVRPAKKVGTFDVIAGFRRLKALQSLGYKDDVKVLIRPDLLGEDERALAVSINENSQDARTELNMIEIGRACQRLEKKKWTVARIAAETGLDTQRVRRALALMSTPDDVQSKVERGDWSAAAGLEYAKLDEKTRERIKSKLTAAATADDIKRARKEAERDQLARGAAKGEPPVPRTKDGKSVGKRPSLAVWQGSRAKVDELQKCCHVLVTADKDDIGSPEFHALRGCIGWALWDRGDRPTPLPPELDADPKDPDHAAIQKDLATFESVVRSEAKRYQPDEPEKVEPPKAAAKAPVKAAKKVTKKKVASAK